MKVFTLFISYIIVLFFSIGHAFAINVNEAFVDVERDYIYYSELQYLYDEGYITPDEGDLLNPDRIIKKGELSAVSFKLNCGECIQPKTSPDLLTLYEASSNFFDIPRENDYFYCSEASRSDGLFYDLEIGGICEDGIFQAGSVPFCEQNNISLQEALKFGLQSSGLFTNDQYRRELENINLGDGGNSSLSNDVSYLNTDGTINPYFLYLRKALGYILEERDLDGRVKNYDLLDVDSDNNISPEALLTRENYIYMMYILAKSIDCGNNHDADFAAFIDIYPASCEPGEPCDKPELIKDVNSLDFIANYAGTCEDKDDETKDVIWTFMHRESGFQEVKFGEYIDDYEFNEDGIWNIILNIEDTCENVSSAGSIIVIGTSEVENSLSIETSANNVTAGSTVDFRALTTNEETTDFLWDFGNNAEGIGKTTSETFDEIGAYRIELRSEGQIAFAHINVYESNIGIAAFIDIYPVDCTQGEECGKANLEAPATSYDLYANYAGVCADGIDESIGVVWRFTHTNSGTSVIQKGGYIEDFNFSKNGKRNITLTIIDNCGETGSAQSTLFIGPGSGGEESSLGIEADAINVQPGDIVTFRGLSSDPDADDFTWDFGDGSNGSGETVPHSFSNPGSYIVELNSGGNSAYVTINVYEETEESDRDGDGIIDSEDRCITVPGVAENAGCPVFPIDNGIGGSGGGDTETACGGLNGGCPSGYMCSIPASGVGQGLCLLDDVCLVTLNGGSFGNVSCNSCPCRYSVDFDSQLRICDIVFPAITSRDGTEIYSKGDVYQILQ